MAVLTINDTSTNQAVNELATVDPFAHPVAAALQ
jgi:hypothetical protein